MCCAINTCKVVDLGHLRILFFLQQWFTRVVLIAPGVIAALGRVARLVTRCVDRNRHVSCTLGLDVRFDVDPRVAQPRRRRE